MTTADDEHPKPLTWGVIGPGHIATQFARSLAQARAGRVVTAFGGRRDPLLDFCDTYGAQPTESLEDCVADPRVDAVYVATPHVDHARAVRAAFAARRPVLCEKPVSVLASTTEALFQEASQAGVLLLEGWMYRHHPQIARACALIRDDVIGRVQRIRSSFGVETPFDPEHRLFSPELGGGSILDLGGYPLSFAMLLAAASSTKTSRVPTLIVASAKLASTGVDANASAVLSFTSGVSAEITVSITEPIDCRTIIEGELGTIVVPEPFLPEGQRDGRRGEVQVTRDGHETVSETLVSDTDCFGMQARAFAAMVRDRSFRPDVPFVGRFESLAIARLMDGWRSRVGAIPAADRL